MTGVITALAWACAAIVTLPSLMFVIECVAGLWAGAPAPLTGAMEPPPFAVLMPAHDEARGIAGTIAAARAQLRPCDRLLVVADNCTDATAEIALRSGAQLLIRHDPARPGKGHALAAGRDALCAWPPAVVIVLDADCVPGAGALPRLAGFSAQHGAVAQGLYTLAARGAESSVGGLSTFAFRIKNQIRQRGLTAIGGPALLQGSGMAFPWAVFAAAPLATGEIVEDLELGLTLALAGTPLRFCEAAAFHSDASAAHALGAQRTRWEHGSLGLAWRYVPPLLAAAATRDRRLWPLALDLIVPPLTLLVAAMAAGLALTGAIGLSGGGYGAAGWIAANVALFGAVVILLWYRFGRCILPFAALMRVPAYLWWKLPIYRRLLVRRETRWIRTGRD